MTLEAPSHSNIDNKPVDERSTLVVPERTAQNDEPALPYLNGNWDYAAPQVEGQTTIINENGTYLNLTPEELNNYVAVDQEAAAARAAARAEAKAEEERQDAEFTDDERRAEAAELYAYLDELASKELAEAQPATEAKTSFGRNILRYFTERDPETGEFSYGSGFLTRGRTPKALATEVSPATEPEVAPAEQPAATEQTTERPSRRNRIGKMMSAMRNKISRNETHRQLRAEAKAHKLEAKAQKAWEKSDRLYDKIESQREEALENEAYLQNEIADAHDEAIVMDSHYEEDNKMWEEAKTLMEAHFEEKAEAERQAELQAGRDKIHAATKAKVDKILDKAIAKAEKKQAKGAKKEQNYSGDKQRIRSRIAQSLMAINRQ